MVVNRVRSTYTLDVKTDEPNKVADELVKSCPVTVAASGVDHRRAFVRFRATDDREALRIAGQITDGRYTLHTGYGVNQRVVIDAEF